MTELLSAIVLWLSITFGLPADYDHPNVEFASSQHISNLRYASAAMGDRPNVMAIYDTENRVIYLDESWSDKSLADLSILVHEMVHHLQNVSRVTHACPAAREQLAYKAQDRWLNLFGSNLADEFKFDSMFLKIATICFWP